MLQHTYSLYHYCMVESIKNIYSLILKYLIHKTNRNLSITQAHENNTFCGQQFPRLLVTLLFVFQ